MSPKRRHGKKDEAENIKVLIRSRPLNTKELEAGMKPAVELDLSEGTVTVNHICGQPDRWTFDSVVNNTYSQKDIFVQFIQPMVDSVLEGFNATIFAYGQSGSGKTYTMSGSPVDSDLKGIIPRSFVYIFNHIMERRKPNVSYSLSCSFLELYNGKIRDLLAKQQVPLQIKETKEKTFYVHDLSTPQVKFVEDLMRYMEEGTVRRQVAATELNTDSSRSHSIFTVSIQMVETLDDGECSTVTSKLNLVDLAGSERQSKTRASGDTLKEGCNINLSLSALGTVIDTIVKGKGHIPFRSSPLTMLLKDSLGGNSKTCMFANINPADSNISETVSTLRFADRAKQIKNKPMVQMDAKDAKIQELISKVHDLQEKLKKYEADGTPDLEEANERLEERVSELEGDLTALREEMQDSATEFREELQLKEKEIEKMKSFSDEQEEAITELRDSLNVTQAKSKEDNSFLLELQDIIVTFSSEVHQREITTMSDSTVNVTVLRGLLEEAKQSLSGVPAEHLQQERERLEVELSTVQQQLTAEVTRLQILQAETQQELSAVTERHDILKEKLEKQKQSSKKLLEAHKADIEDLKQQHATETDALKDKLDQIKAHLQEAGASSGSSANKDGMLADSSLQGRFELLEKELAQRDQMDSDNNMQTRKAVAKAKAAQTEAEAEVSKVRQRMAEPCLGDSAVISRLKTELQLLDSNLSAVTDERNVLQLEVDNVREIVVKAKRSAGKFEARCKGLEERQRKSMEVRKGGEGQEAALADEITGLQSRNAELEVDVRNRDSLIESLQEDLKADADRSSARYEALDEQREKLLDALTQGNDDNAMQQALQALRTELREERLEVKKLMRRIKETSAKDTAEAQLQTGPSEVQQLQKAFEKKEQRYAERVMELEEALAEPADNDSGRLADLKKELRMRDKTAKSLKAEVKELSVALATAKKKLKRKSEGVAGDSQTPADAACISPDLDTSRMLRDLEECQKEISHLKEEKNEISTELEQAGRDLKSLLNEKDKRRADYEAVLKELEERNGDARRAREEINKLTAQKRDEERLSQRWKQERDAAVAAADRVSERLQERDDALKQMRNAHSHQAQMLDRHKKQEAKLQEQLELQREQISLLSASWEERLHEEQSKWTKGQSKKMEEVNEQHEKALQKKEEELEQMRRKVKKAHHSVQKAKERYDSKVLEAAELRSRLEELKEDALKRLREKDANRELDDSRDEINNIIRNSKAAHNRVLGEHDPEEVAAKVKKCVDLENSKIREKRKISAAQKQFEGNSATMAAQQASAAARVRASGAVASYNARYPNRSSGTHEGGSAPSSRRSSDVDGAQEPFGEMMQSPVPPAPPVDNDTPNQGIHRQLSPRVQFNPRNRQRDIEDRIRVLDDEPPSVPDPLPRGPSTLNRYSALPQRASFSGTGRYERVAEAPSTSRPIPTQGLGPSPPPSTNSMGLGPSVVPSPKHDDEPTRTSVPLPGKRI